MYLPWFMLTVGHMYGVQSEYGSFHVECTLATTAATCIGWLIISLGNGCSSGELGTPWSQPPRWRSHDCDLGDRLDHLVGVLVEPSHVTSQEDVGDADC